MFCSRPQRLHSCFEFANGTYLLVRPRPNTEAGKAFIGLPVVPVLFPQCLHSDAEVTVSTFMLMCPDQTQDTRPGTRGHFDWQRLIRGLFCYGAGEHERGGGGERGVSAGGEPGPAAEQGGLEQQPLPAPFLRPAQARRPALPCRYVLWPD